MAGRGLSQPNAGTLQLAFTAKSRAIYIAFTPTSSGTLVLLLQQGASQRYPLLLGFQDITRIDVVTLCVLGMTAAEWGQLCVESLSNICVSIKYLGLGGKLQVLLGMPSKTPQYLSFRSQHLSQSWE